ncbi:MAG: hypothetical protein ACOVNU_03040 [Candidatus Kapaibacteriota bacterium]
MIPSLIDLSHKYAILIKDIDKTQYSNNKNMINRIETLLNIESKSDIGNFQSKKTTDNIIYGDKNIIIAGDTKLNSKYAIVELEDIIPSNEPFSFNKNPKYPANCQTRDYSKDYEQAKVLNNAKNFDYRYLINEIPNGAEGSPITDTDLNVMGGNSRIMTLNHLAKYYDFDELYKKPLYKYSEVLFGIDKDKYKSFKYPILIRMITDCEGVTCSCEFLSRALQDNQSQKIDYETESIALAKQLSEETVEKIINNLTDEVTTLSELYNNKPVHKRVIDQLREARVITNANQSEWLDSDGYLSEIGKVKFESMLLGLILDTKELLNSAENYKNTIIRALPEFLKIKNLPNNWNIIPNLLEALKLERKRRSTNMSVEEYLSQTSLLDAAINEETKLIWKALAMNKPNLFKKFIKNWIKSAKTNIDIESGNTFLMEEPAKPIDVLREYIDKRNLQGIEDEDNLYSNDIFNSLSDNYDEFTEYQNKLNTLPKLTTVADVLKNEYQSKPLRLVRTKKLFHNLLNDAKVFVQGLAGQGKSTFCIQFADDLALNGKVLYVLAEEKKDTRFQERLRRNNVFTPNIEILETRDFDIISEYVATGNYSSVIIDSHNELTNVSQKEITEWIKNIPCVVVIITRMEKTGKRALGSSDWTYIIDTVVDISNGVAMIPADGGKHRDGAVGGKMQVLPNKSWSHIS